MLATVELGVLDRKTSLIAQSAVIVDSKRAVVHMLQGRRTHHIEVTRGNPVTTSCSCGARRQCAHAIFAIGSLEFVPRTQAWLATGSLPASVEADAETDESAGGEAPAAPPPAPSQPTPSRKARGKSAAPAKSESPARPDPQEATELAAAAAADETQADVDEWLRAIGRDQRASPSGKAAQAPREVVYFVTPDATVDGLAVTVWSAKPRKGGELARNRPLDLMRALRGKIPLRAQDLGLIATLRGHSQEGWRDSVVLAGDASALVSLLIDSGRCYLDGREPRLLSRGEEHRAELGWTVDETGAQIPAVLDEGKWPLLFDEPMYIDVHLATVGKLTFGPPLAVARAFLAGPEVPAEASAAVAQTSGRRLAKLGLPNMRTLRVERVPAPPPRPQLLLGTAAVSPGAWLDPIALDMAHLTFAYGEHVFDEGAAEDSYREVEGDQVRECRRRRDLERAAVQQLEELGFAPVVDSVPPKFQYAVRHALALAGTRDDLTLNRAYATPDVEAWTRFLGEGRRQLVAAGWEVTVDRSFRHGTIEATRWTVLTRGAEASDWFTLEVGIDIDGERCNLMPVLLHLVAQCANGELPAILRQDLEFAALPLPDGRTIRLSTERVRRMVTALLELQAGGKVEKGQLRLPRLLAPQVHALAGHVDEVAWQDNDAARDLATKLATFTGIDSAPAPADLATELRAYQREGLAWLQFLRAHDLGGILADDMGLGKTVQTLAHILVEKAAGRLDRPCLVVSPTSVVGNWASECARFAPGLRVLVLHGSGRRKTFDSIAEVDVVLTTYPLVVRDAETLQAHAFHLLVLDEAQAIKNSGAKARRVLRDVDARHRLCLTGTPLENNLRELWSQFDFLLPGLLGDTRTFGHVFRGPIEKRDDRDRQRALADRIRPFILRRTKEKVAKELPPKTTVVHTVELAGDQRDLYETIRLAVHERVRQAIADKGLDQAQIIVLDALLKLRQVCCDPRLVKLDSARQVKASAKLEALLELLPSLIEDGRRVLLFSQFTSMLALIEPELRQRGIAFVKLVGDTEDRTTPVRRFQAGEVPVFLISLKAGGTGLNLTAADTVIHYDPWWNPAAEQQATDRAHRIGQDKPVFEYKLIATGTVEERIGRLQERKRALAAGLLDGGERQGTALTREDVEALFAAMDLPADGDA
ncbi:MAG: DEAD/DEAH box helicase [Planctomycetota bacterium]